MSSSATLPSSLAAPWISLGVVGKGATAIVHRAKHASSGVLAAVKVTLAAHAGEAAIVAMLGRRWGPRLLEARRDDARVLLAFEWSEGAPLDPHDVSDRTKVAAIVAHGVGRALAELHAAGVRHGDVKPANILVSDRVPKIDAANDRGATLIDLGLATAAGDDARGGTPRYAAPELARGSDVGPHADSFALGLVLAEIVDPRVCDAKDPISFARALPATTEAMRWAHALLAPDPASRPSAAWIAKRAARVLALKEDAEDARLDRIQLVRRAYLSARKGEIQRATRIDLRGPSRAWLEEVLHALAPLRSEIDPHTIGSSSPLTRARVLVQLVGPAAASWPLPPGSEEDFVTRLLALAEQKDPQAWTRGDLTGASTSDEEAPDSEIDRTAWLAAILARPFPSEHVIALAEDQAKKSVTLAIALADALVRRGELGRAHLALEGIEAPEARAMIAEIARRRGDRALAKSEAERVKNNVRAIATLARLAWDEDDLDRAEKLLGDHAGSAIEEVRALVAHKRGDFARGLERAREALALETSPMSAARLAVTVGYLAEGAGHVDEALASFGRAASEAANAGAVIEEATYRVGEAMAAGDAGDVARALSCSTRAALLLEKLGRERDTAYAWLTRASTLAAIGATHEADEAAEQAIERGDARAAAYARWAIVETRAPGDPRAKIETVRAARALESDHDRLRASARLLIWAPDEIDDAAIAKMDDLARTAGADARWEWWGARAHAELHGRTFDREPIVELLGLIGQPADVSSIGRALYAGAELARRRQNGDAARRFDAARREAAERLFKSTPPEYKSTLASVEWARRSVEAPELGLAPAQVLQLESIVRMLQTRDRLRPLLEQVLDAMVLWTGVERGLLLLRAPGENALVPRAARNLAREDLHGEQLALSQSIAMRALDSGEPVVATDAFATLGDLHASVHALKLRSVLAVPLVARGETLGVVYLDDRARRGAFGPHELAWVRLVASQAAMAIADARDQVLLRRAARRSERARAKTAELLAEREAELDQARTLLESRDEMKYRYDAIAGRSEPMRQMLRVVDRVTSSDVPVLVFGESGTGKELIARAMHQNGPRSKRAFVSENCASVPETLLESTLFGHVKGSFTGATHNRAGLFEVADGGSLFLDEIGEMSLAMQAKLLRVLQFGEIRPVGGDRTRRVEVRLIAATHRDLGSMVEKGTFREDLFYRLNVVTIVVPPLRERAEDIPLLVQHLIEKHAAGRKIKVTRFAMDKLCTYPWPGNVRQLENEIRRSIVLADSGSIDVADLSPDVARGGPSAARGAGLDLRSRVDVLEKELVTEALARTRGNQTKAAELLGLSRFGLQKMMKRLRIPT